MEFASVLRLFVRLTASAIKSSGTDASSGETAAVNTPDEAQDAPAASGEGERKEEAEVCV